MTLFYLIYLFPAIFLFICYVILTIKEIKADIKECEKSYYTPRVTLGKIVTRLLVCFIPVVNIIGCFIFFINHIDDIANFPVIPKK